MRGIYGAIEQGSRSRLTGKGTYMSTRFTLSTRGNRRYMCAVFVDFAGMDPRVKYFKSILWWVTRRSQSECGALTHETTGIEPPLGFSSSSRTARLTPQTTDLLHPSTNSQYSRSYSPICYPLACPPLYLVFGAFSALNPINVFVIPTRWRHEWTPPPIRDMVLRHYSIGAERVRLKRQTQR